MTGGRSHRAAASNFISQEFAFALPGSAPNVSCPRMTGLQPHPIEVSYSWVFWIDPHERHSLDDD